MLSALLYLQVHSIGNRLWQRLKRLRRPRYLFGALVGAFYLVMMFGRATFVFGRQDHSMTGLLPAISGALLEFITALLLLVGLLLVWIVPHERAALVFSEAEIAFLFPAPVRRQTLIHYKLVRSQAAILMTVMFLTLLSHWSGGMVGALRRAAGWWLLISTVNLHLLGSSFTRTTLLDRGLTPWRRRLVIMTSAVAMVGLAAWWASRAASGPTERDLLSRGTVETYIETISRTPPAVVLLAPFRWVTRPFLTSDDPTAFWRAVGPALIVLTLHYWWVLRADVAFEEASLEASQRHAGRVQAARSGRWRGAGRLRGRHDPFRLSPTGPPAVAILWKNLLSAGQMFNSRMGLALLIGAMTVGSTMSATAGKMLWTHLLGNVAGIAALWSVVLGPQFVRQDFRQDLVAADLLKMYPMPGWQMALGELLAPALILSVFQWGLILLAALLIGGSGRGWPHDAGQTVRSLPLAFSAAVMVGPLNLVSLLIPNAAALLLPAWFAGAAGGTRGLEATGQRLIFLLAQFIALVVALFPAALMAFLVYSLSPSPSWPLAATVAALVLAMEAAGGLAMLGHWFETYDLSAEIPS